VHVVVKAVIDQGERLNIRKDTLRHWREEFARQLRALGVEANATERAVRGKEQTTKSDGIYRAMRRGDSSHMRERVEEAAMTLVNGRTTNETGKATLRETRLQVMSGWTAVANLLGQQGDADLAARVREFLGALPRVRTDRELIAEQLSRQLAAQRSRTLGRDDAR
jgi:hypothetical protein